MFFTLFFYTEHSRAAEQGKCGSDAFYSFDEETGVMTISGTGVISREWDDILQEKIEQLVIEEGITTLPYEFFLDCTTLKKVQLAGTVKMIRACAFYGCENLSEINLPEGLEEIHYNAFTGCASLKEITIPKSLKSGGTDCFAGCALEQVTFAPGITTVVSELFSGCTDLKQIELPDSIRTIGYAAFSGCVSLQVSKLPPNLTQIGNNAFYLCKAMTTTEIPNTVNKIGDYAYYGSSISKVILSSNVTTIGYYAFNKYTVIYGEDESAAQTYAKKYGNSYVPTKRAMKNVKLSAIPAQNHTGKAVMPVFAVTDGKKTLQLNKNYRVSYKDNINLGTAKVTVTGMDGFYFGSQSTSFQIIASKGEIYKKGNIKYKVTDNRINGKGTVEVLGMIKRKTSVSIPKTIKIGKYKYKVTAIAKKAFYKKKKIKKITISSTTISRIGSKAIKGIYKTARIKVPKKKKKSYKKMLKKAGLGKKVKVV